MKREERNTLNALRRDINPGTINVEVPTTYTHEGRQEIHHMLTLEKGFVAVRIYWNDIKKCTAVHYIPAGAVYADIRREQETMDIDTITANLPDCSGWTWNGYRAPGNEEEPTEDTTTNDNTKEDETMTTINNTTTATLTNGASINTAERVLNAAEDLITATKCRSAWAKGVTVYALELLEDLRESCTGGWFEEDDLGSSRLVEKGLLNGASDWTQYSWGGCSLIYDPQIAARLCTKSELKLTRNGERNPNSREQWLDTQARALYQAARIVVDAVTRSYTFNA